jgi:hypothetical protein
MKAYQVLIQPALRENADDMLDEFVTVPAIGGPIAPPPSQRVNHDFEAIDTATESAFRALRDEVTDARSAPALAANGNIDTVAAAANRLRLVREILRRYGGRYLKGRDADVSRD